MLRGIYTAGMGMSIQSKKMDVISNNLANVNTNGYKRDSVVFQSFNNVLTNRINDSYTPANPSGKIGYMDLSSNVSEIFTDYSQGKLINTGNKLDLAISNSDTAFFTVEVPSHGQTEERYTRDGAFTIDASGMLVTKEGYAVKGENGSIILDEQDFQVNARGEIIQDGNIVDRLKLKTFKDKTCLTKVGDNLVKVEGEVKKEDFNGTIVQGFTETSNVNSIREMIDMLTLVKAYEASQKAIKAHDEILGRAVNDVPSLRA